MPEMYLGHMNSEGSGGLPPPPLTSPAIACHPSSLFLFSLLTVLPFLVLSSPPLPSQGHPSPVLPWENGV